VNLWCRLGLHKWLIFSEHVRRPSDGVWFDVTKNRCERDGCKYFWWTDVEVTRSRIQEPLR
jgi:hypothetical protein